MTLEAKTGFSAWFVVCIALERCMQNILSRATLTSLFQACKQCEKKNGFSQGLPKLVNSESIRGSPC